MTPSELDRRHAVEILDYVAAEVAGSPAQQALDERIDHLTLKYECPDDAQLTHGQFLDATADFLRYLYALATPQGRQLSHSQARDEVIALLEEAYEGTFSHGSYEAFRDATDSQRAGLALVLATVAELVKNRQRQAGLRRVVARMVDSATWQVKCEMAAILLERCRPWLPPDLQNAPPEQMANDILALLMLGQGQQPQGRSMADSMPAPYR